MFTGSSAEACDVIGSDSGDGISGASDPTPEILIRQATAEDIRCYYGSVPGTMRAMVAEMDGELVGLIGVIRATTHGRFFCDFKPELQPYLQSIKIMRAVKAAHRFCDEYRGPIVAVAEHAEGCRILNRLGWTHLDGVLYAWLR